MKKRKSSIHSSCKLLIIWALALSLFLQTCHKEKEISTAFYHWKTNYHPTDFENSVLDSLNVERIYAKFFDVDWVDGAAKATPNALIQSNIKSNHRTIIPTVFITNKTFIKLKTQNIRAFAAQVHGLIAKLSEQFPKVDSEAQFDCDWTQSTKEKYFEFLKVYKNIDQQTISATIRLHQIKYSKRTGIPPVDKGALMFYNMGEVNELATNNSIIDLNIANQYIDNLINYKLPLSIALPIYRWGVVFRGERFVQLINEIGPEQLLDTSLVAPLDNHRYQILQNTYLEGHYFYEDDIIRLEDSSKEIVQQSVDLLTTKIKQDQIEVIYYHLDSLNLERHFNHQHGL